MGLAPYRISTAQGRPGLIFGYATLSEPRSPRGSRSLPRRSEQLAERRDPALDLAIVEVAEPEDRLGRLGRATRPELAHRVELRPGVERRAAERDLVAVRVVVVRLADPVRVREALVGVEPRAAAAATWESRSSTKIVTTEWPAQSASSTT